MSESEQNIAEESGRVPRREFHSPRDRRRLQETLAYKQAGDLLELGFGHGGFLSLASRHFKITGIDHSRNRVEKVQAANDGRVTLRMGDIESEDFGRERFDVVAAFNILEHLHVPHRTVDRIASGLRESGILIGSVPNNQPVLGAVSTVLSNLGDRTHYSTFPPDDWQRIFERAGFREIIFFGELLFTKYMALYVRHSLWRYYTYNLIFVCRK